MRVAAIYDIHGNLPALEAVLQEIRQAEVDHVVVGDDVVPGTMPREILMCLLDLGIPVQFINGNGEVAALEQMAGADPATIPDIIGPSFTGRRSSFILSTSACWLDGLKANYLYGLDAAMSYLEEAKSEMVAE